MANVAKKRGGVSNFYAREGDITMSEIESIYGKLSEGSVQFYKK